METEEDFNRHFEEVVSVFDASDDGDASRVPRRAGTMFTLSFGDIHHKGKVLKTDGAFVHVEWVDHILPNTSFQIHEWQQLAREQKIKRDANTPPCPFVVERATTESDAGRGVARCIRDLMEGVEQLHVFLAKEGSVAGNKWNRITIDHLRNTIVPKASRTTGMHTDQGGVFNYLVQLTEAMAMLMPKVFKDPNLATSKKFARPKLSRLGERGHLRLWAQLDGRENGTGLEFVPSGLCASDGYFDDFIFEDASLPSSVRTYRYKRTCVVDETFQVEQRRFVLEVPGFAQVDTSPYPDNDDIEIVEGRSKSSKSSKLKVRLSRPHLVPTMDNWLEDGLSEVSALEKTTFQFDLDMNWSGFEVTQEDGLLTILVNGVKTSR